MTTLTSALNYGALITLSCCNAVLQIAAAPVCADPAQDSSWPACAPDGVLGETELRRKLFRPGRTTRMVLAERAGAAGADGDGRFVARFHGDGKLEGGAAGGDNVARGWRIDGGRVCLDYDPGYRSQPECGAFEVLRGRLYLVEDEGQRKPVDSVEWAAN
ncbi:hypothetical protein ACFPOE_14100 [Caenimonas terrae]|uniref:Uncharacterized protein n=1 Tax=Caenimonas terrae TaxID=696074 RepID=A0ABW0NDQ6_9BURK